MARTASGALVRGYSPMAGTGEPRRSNSASPLIAPPLVGLSTPPLSVSSPLVGASLPDQRLANSTLSSNLAELRTSIQPVGPSVSDLRAAVTAQQRQLDGLVDKVANLLSTMHAEVLDDVRKTCRPGTGATLDYKEFVQFVDLRESEGNLRLWLQAQVRNAWDRLEAKIHDVEYHISSEMRDLRQHVAGDVHSIRARVSHLEDMTLDNDDDGAELRRQVEERLEAQAAQLHGSMGQLAAELQQQVSAGLEAQGPGQDGSLQHFADAVLRNVEERLQEHGAVDGGAVNKLREELRQEAETRLEAKMTQTFGLAQRLMNELRQELQDRVVQVFESSQTLAIELHRELEGKQVHLEASLEQLALERAPCGPGGGGRHGGLPATDASQVAVEEQLAGCRAAAADCARCAIEASEATDTIEAQFEALSERLAGELQQDLGVQLERGLEVLQRGLGKQEASHADGAVAEASLAALEERLVSAQTEAADSRRCAQEAVAKAEAAERHAGEVSQRLPAELFREAEAQEARLRQALQQALQQSMREEVRSAVEAEAKAKDRSPATPEAPLPAIEERLASVLATTAEAMHSAGEAKARAQGVEERFEELSRSLAGELREGCEAQEARMREALQHFVHEEVQQGRGPAVRAAADGVPAAAEGGPGDPHSREPQGSVEASVALAEEHLAGCKAAAAACERCIEEASSKVSGADLRLKACVEEASSKVDHAQAQLKACVEDFKAQLTEEGRRILDELGAARPAGAAAATEGGEGWVSSVQELAQRLVELEEDLMKQRGLLVDIHERVLGAGPGDEGSRSASRSGSPSGELAGLCVRSPLGQGGRPAGRRPRSASETSEEFES